MTPAVLWRAQKTPLRLGDFRGHALRGLLIALATLCFFAAIRDNPIPDTIAIFFVEPIFVMLLAAMFLGEKLRRRRIVAALTAFVGVLIVMRPGGGHYEPSIFFALLAGFFFRGLSGGDSHVVVAGVAANGGMGRGADGGGFFRAVCGMGLANADRARMVADCFAGGAGGKRPLGADLGMPLGGGGANWDFSLRRNSRGGGRQLFFV